MSSQETVYVILGSLEMTAVSIATGTSFAAISVFLSCADC